MTEGERPQADAAYVEDAVTEPWPELAWLDLTALL